MNTTGPLRSYSRDPPSQDSNRFLNYSRLHPRPSSAKKSPEDPKTGQVQTRLQKVVQKIMGNFNVALTAYSEEMNPSLTHSRAWKEIVQDLHEEKGKLDQDISLSPGKSSTKEFSLVSEMLAEAQAKVLNILKEARRNDEMNLKAKL